MAISTWASFASMWLIPRLEMFQRAHPDVVIHNDATDVMVDLDTTDMDLAQHALVKASDAHRSKRMQWLTWQRWFDAQGLKIFAPKRWLYLNYACQIAQAALTGQGIALARMPLVADSLASGDLVEPLHNIRIDSPPAYSISKSSVSLLLRLVVLEHCLRLRA